MVKGKAPLLISHGVMESLDASYNTHTVTAEFRELGVTAQLTRSSADHPTLDLCQFLSEGFNVWVDMGNNQREIRLPGDTQYDNEMPTPRNVLGQIHRNPIRTARPS